MLICVKELRMYRRYSADEGMSEGVALHLPSLQLEFDLCGFHTAFL